MATKTVDTNDYFELLKGHKKSIIVTLPVLRGTMSEIKQKVELALREKGWDGKSEYRISSPSAASYYGYAIKPAKATYNQELTREEIEKYGARFYKQKLTNEKKEELVRQKNLVKLQELQAKLGLEVTKS